MAVHPIRLYGDPILRQKTVQIDSVTQELHDLIQDMIETMHHAEGIGLAAPQIGRSESLFVVDVSPIMEDVMELQDQPVPSQPMIFVNPEILWESDDEVEYEEGCLSIPEIKEMVYRSSSLKIQFQDVTLQEQVATFEGFLARVIQHEYDHLHGVLFLDHISSFRRNLLKRKLRHIRSGNIETTYPVQPVSSLR
ncbi:MAG: peptide deformylase [Bacteroidetes bacterium]|nr:peptide deformylase [Bacteroidota bacterium]